MENGIAGITRFQQDRGLDKQPFNWLNECTNIVEEMFEAAGCDVPKTRRPELMDMLDAFEYSCRVSGISKCYDEPTVEERVDAFGDIIVFACGALTKLGYDPELVLQEVSKEINSRVGEMVNGKFEKDTSEEAKKNWYTANFSECKLQTVTSEDRDQFFKEEGYMTFDEDIKRWKNRRRK